MIRPERGRAAAQPPPVGAQRRRSRAARTAHLLAWAGEDALEALRRWRPPDRGDPGTEVRAAPPREPRQPELSWGQAAPARIARASIQRGAMFPLLTTLGRPETTGLHHLQGARPPFILAPNHVSHADAPLVLMALPAWLRERTIVPAAKDYFFDRQWLSVLVTLAINAVPFDRRHEIADSVRRCERLLRHGHSVVLFPEGTRSTDGRLRGFRSGVAHLAVQTGAPLIPVFVQGTHGMLPRGRRLPRPSAVAIHFGAPLHAARDESARQFNGRVEDAVIALGSDASGWGWRDREPRVPGWRERWAQEHSRGAFAGTDEELPLTGGWRARWRSTTPR